MTEEDLCEEFRDAAKRDGWVVHPEVMGWDLVLVKDGVQVAVEAKLTAGIGVIAQTLARNRKGHPSGPDYKAVLVPKASATFRGVCTECRIHVYDIAKYAVHGTFNTTTFEYRMAIREVVMPDFRFERAYGKPLWLPPIVSDRPAGQPAPSSLTQWRVKALQFCILLEQQGYVTSRDMKAHDMSATTWVYNRGYASWLVNSGEKVGKLTKYVTRDPRPSDFPSIGFETELARLAESDPG